MVANTFFLSLLVKLILFLLFIILCKVKRVIPSCAIPNLQVEMYNKVLVHVVDSLTDLAHEQNAVSLSEGEVVCHHTLKQLTTRDAGEGGREGRFSRVLWDIKEHMTI